MKSTSLIISFVFILTQLYSQQVADTSYNPPIVKPAYEIGKGPVVFIDEGHHNFHTKNERYKPFSMLLERDGYVVKGFADKFELSKLTDGKILVISNALNEINVENWYLPTPSAFTLDEIEIVHDFVENGGRLFLIADHMPMAGAAQELAKAFGFDFSNGFAFDTTSRGPSLFSVSNGTLASCSITRGRDSSEKVNNVYAFTGQGFKIPTEATPILTFGENYISMNPDTAWVFNNQTPRIDINGWSQGAYMEYGKGRIVIFGEAAMFTAQLAGPQRVKIGINSEYASENHRLLLNIIHWLDGMYE